MSRRMAIMPVSIEALRQVLCLPDSVRIDAVSGDVYHDRILLRIECPEFDLVTEGATFPTKTALYLRDAEGNVEFTGWS